MKNNKLSTELNKIAILNRIKDHYGFRKHKELADFLGIAATTLSSWFSRNSLDFDLVIDKCVEMDLNKMFRGKGFVVKAGLDNENESEEKEFNSVELLQLIREKDLQINRMAEEVGKLKEQNRVLKKELNKE